MAKQFTARIFGMKKTELALKKLGSKAPKALGKAFFNEAEIVMTDSKLQVPVDFGALRDSSFVDLPKIRLNNVSVELGYGGPAAPYALVQHERLDFAHTVGKAKYLEDPYNAALKGLDQRVAVRLKKEMRI